MRSLAWRFIARTRILATTSAVVTALSGTLAAPAFAVPGSAAAPARAASPGDLTAAASTAVTRQSNSKTILLLNGDRLIVDGKSSAIELAGSGFSAAVTQLRLAGRQYAIPDAALPFLGHGLDLSLFDAAARPGGATLPLRITYSGRAPRLPGVTITHAAGGLATGYLTAAGARRFGAALVRQYAADHARARYGTDGLFAGGVWISTAAGPAAVRPAGQTPRSPQYPMHTVTVHGITATGRPDNGDLVFLYNASNNAIYGDPYEDPSAFYHGTARFSVPSGQYWALAWFTTMDRKGNPASLRMVMAPRLVIQGKATVTLRARSATSRLTFTAPRPAALLASVAQFVVTDSHRDVTGFAVFQGPGMPVWVSPTTQRLAAGSMREYVNAWLSAPAAGPPAPDTARDLYAGMFSDSSGLIRPQHFALSAASLATVHAAYASGVTTTAGVILTPFTAAELTTAGTIGLIAGVQVPARVTEHLLTGPGVYWDNAYLQSAAAFGGGQSDGVRAFTAGSDTTQAWNVFPLHTPLNSSTGVSTPANPFFAAPLSATRTGRSLTIDVTPFTDDTPGHTGTGFAQGLFRNIGTIGGSFEIDDNGTRLDSGKIPPSIFFGSFDDQVRLPSAPSTVAFTLRASRTGPLFPLSTAVTDRWTWQSSAGPVTTVPATWTCADGAPACAVQPLLTAGYQVRGIALDGTAPPGPQQVTLAVGHQALVASPPAVTSVTASYSLDGGASWQPATVTGGGTWSLALSAPAGSYVSLRISAADAAGGTLTETISRAFATQTAAAAARVRHAGTPAPGTPGTPGGSAAGGYQTACAAPGAGQARCFVLFAPEPAAAASVAAPSAGTAARPGRRPAGWGPRDIEHAYKLPVGRDSRATVAVVEAYDTPKLQTYLNAYRREYGLRPCTAGNGCFRKVGQNGSARHLPHSGVLSGWDLEATLDVDMVSAACPSCRILVVEASGQRFSQLAAAEDTAVRLGASVISNSYGARENGLAQSFARAYDHRGVTIVASSGDYGFTAASFPADLRSVTAAGGTELARAKNKRGWRETVWNSPGLGAGSSGCSAYVAKPSWQHDRHCAGRTVADVSAVALNIAIYNRDWGGWGLVGGTSASSPVVAGVYALAGNAKTVRPGYEYAHTRALFDVTAGNNDWFYGENGAVCGRDYLCVAKKGYDAPTGLGTPDGTGAF